MRYVSYLIAALILVNVIVFLWPKNGAVPAHLHPVKVDVNAELLKLNKEVEEAYYEKQNNQNMSDALQPGENLAQLRSCYRLGPFRKLSNFEVAQAALLNVDVSYTKSKRKVTNSEVFRLYVGPFQNRSEATTQRGALNELGVLDHFSRTDADGTTIISLGIYSSLATAEKGAVELKEKVDRVKLRRETVTLPETYWLYFSLRDNDNVRQQLEAMDWGELSARIGPFTCQ